MRTQSRLPDDVERLVETAKEQLLCYHRVDILLERRVVLEIKSVERLHPLHVAQVASYLRLTRAPVGLLVNFNTDLLQNGLRRVVV